MISLQLTKKNIEAINEIANYIDQIDYNTENNEHTLQSLSQFLNSDDLELLLLIFKSINKKKTNLAYKAICDSKKTKDKKTTEANNSYTKDMVLEMFDQYTDEEIIKQHGFKDLKKMYDILYNVNGKKPLVPKTKNEIIKSIRNYIYRVARAKMFK